MEKKITYNIYIKVNLNTNIYNNHEHVQSAFKYLKYVKSKESSFMKKINI